MTDLAGKKAIKKKKVKAKVKRGVVYLTQLPHGFYEKEMRSYFTQFGKVLKVRVARSRKTLNSKGYAYVEFANDDVSKIVAETMNNYLMFDKLIKSKYIPPEQVHPNLFFRPSDTSKLVSTRKKALKTAVSEQTDDSYKKAVMKIVSRVEATKKKLKELGIDFKFDLEVPDFNNTKKKTHKYKEVSNTSQNAEEEDDESSNESKTEIKDLKKKTNVKEFTAKANSTPQKARAGIQNGDGASKSAKLSSKKKNKNLSNSAAKSKKSAKKEKKLGSEPSELEKSYVLEVHSSDEEISFKTPPNTIKQCFKTGTPLSSLKKGKRKMDQIKTPIGKSFKSNSFSGTLPSSPGLKKRKK